MHSQCGAGLFGGSGIFDIIANPVEEAAEEAVEKAGEEAAQEAAEAGPQASKALSSQEVPIEDDGFPTNSTPQDRNQYWAGPRGPNVPSGKDNELKRPGEQRGRRPPTEQPSRYDSPLLFPVGAYSIMPGSASYIA